MKNQKSDTRHRSLSLPDMSFAFFVLGPGLGLAAFAFLVEFISKRLMNAKNNKNNPKTSKINQRIKPTRKGKPAINKKNLLVVVAAAAVVNIEEVPGNVGNAAEISKENKESLKKVYFITDDVNEVEPEITETNIDSNDVDVIIENPKNMTSITKDGKDKGIKKPYVMKKDTDQIIKKNKNQQTKAEDDPIKN